MNAEKFATVCAAGQLAPWACSYSSAMHTNAQTVGGLYRFLSQMNPTWLPDRVAVLQEANTSFGLGFNPATRDRNLDGAPETEDASARALVDQQVHRYSFPLHISQLREDSRSAPGLPSLLTSPAVALRLGESVRPVDLVPPMRPDVASPVTDLTMAATLDDIRHRGFAAVGIYATDVRDTLYLSREVKRAAPNIQLFYPSGHLLFQHQDFVAFTRGAIVASTYPLSAIYQLWGGERDSGKAARRETFSSTVAEGVFNATLAQAAGDGYLADHPAQSDYTVLTATDRVGYAKLGAKPPLWLTIVGDDGFWPLRQDGPGAVVPRLASTRWPVTGVIVAVALVVLILLHAWVASARLAARAGWTWGVRQLARIQRVGLLNVLVPPDTMPEFARLHRVMSGIAFGNVACLAYWGLSLGPVRDGRSRARRTEPQPGRQCRHPAASRRDQCHRHRAPPSRPLDAATNRHAGHVDRPRHCGRRMAGANLLCPAAGGAARVGQRDLLVRERRRERAVRGRPHSWRWHRVASGAGDRAGIGDTRSGPVERAAAECRRLRLPTTGARIAVVSPTARGVGVDR
jgi:hypothetical protein